MSINILFSARPGLWDIYKKTLVSALSKAGIDSRLARDFSPDQVDYIIFAPNGPVSDFTPYTRCKAVLGLWAGVESIVNNQTLTQPLTRMVDPGLSEGMTEWVVGHVLRHHLEMDRDILRSDREWMPHIPPLARNRKVGVLGLGALGASCAQALAGLNFQVSGWSRNTKNLAGITTFSGENGLAKVLEYSEILVLLLPLTAATENILDANALAKLPKGAVIINPGRGPLIDDSALINALDSGQVGHATLDVFRIEPLPQDHPFWAQPNVTVTPHIASETRPETAANMIAENIRRSEAGKALLHLVDRAAGY